MSKDLDGAIQRLDQITIAGAITRAEIFQQPELWKTTLERVRDFDVRNIPADLPVVITGAGTSAHAATAIASAWGGARAIPTTDLLTNHENCFRNNGLLLSVARSGDSPESVEVVRRIQQAFPKVRHLAITCNSNGRLAHHEGVEVLALDPRTNDRGLAMTSSFSNLVLAGLACRNLEVLTETLPGIFNEAERSIETLDEQAKQISLNSCSRAIVLSSAALAGAAREASLKILELTAGQIAVFAETFLGVRHGPMSFLRADTLVLCILSSSPSIRRYEEDLIAELRSKNLGQIVAISPDKLESVSSERHVSPLAPSLPDYLRTPFEIVFPQLLAWHLSVKTGLDPDNPSPDGVINRVVQNVRIFNL